MKTLVLTVLGFISFIDAMELDWTPIDESEVPKHHSIDLYKSYTLHLKNCDADKKEKLIKLIHPIREQFGPKHETTMRDRHKKGGDYHSAWLIEEEYEHIIDHFSDCLLVSGQADEL